jgi:tRNA threonylcarbamoyl adenosine modification protein YeaZ
MKILTLEFSSPQRSVAVVTASAGGVVRQPRRQTESLPQGTQKARIGKSLTEGIPTDLAVIDATSAISMSEVVETGRTDTMQPLGMIREALEQAGLEREQIECLAVGLGPGSYTGIRTAIALAQGWQLASGAGGMKLLGISSAECVAAQAKAEGIRGRVNVVIDAQRNGFYLAGYELEGEMQRELEPLRLATLAEARKLVDIGATVVGPEVTRWFPQGRLIFPRAGTLGKQASLRTDFTTGERLEPIYLREAKFVKAPPPRVVPSLDSKQ